MKQTQTPAPPEERRLQVGDVVYATLRQGKVIQLMTGKVVGFTPDGICGVQFEEPSQAPAPITA